MGSSCSTHGGTAANQSTPQPAATSSQPLQTPPAKNTGTGAPQTAAAGSASEPGKVLVINSGSSSLKFKLFNIHPFIPLIGGLVERIGDVANSRMVVKREDPAEKWEVDAKAKDHTSALQTMLLFLKEHGYPTIETDVKAVGHRVVHGGKLSQPVLVNDETLEEIKRAAVMAPLHNPAALSGIDAVTEVFQGVPQAVVLDTAYHTATMPEHAFMYGLPYSMYEKHQIRRYGFHGTSHQYLVGQAAQMLGKPVDQVNAISCHLGNGSSLTAVKGGKSVDTSMGLTPLEGLLMGTRCGDMDASVPLFVMAQEGLSAKELDHMMNKQSGLMGMSGQSDLRAVVELAEQGDAKAQLALDMFVYRIRKYLGAYYVALNGHVDCLIFSAGIGENSSLIRGLVCRELEALGISLDEAKNKQAVGGRQMDVSAPGAKVKAFVIPTDEELSIAQQTLGVVGLGGR